MGMGELSGGSNDIDETQAVRSRSSRRAAIRFGGGVLGLTLIAGCASTGGGDVNARPTQAAVSSQSANQAPPAEQASPTSHMQTYTEHADNHLGVPVFADPAGAALKHEPARIGYGTAVQVACFALNRSGMSSINGFYEIVGGTWNGDFAPANTFDNNAGMGPNPVDRDPRVPNC